MKREYLNKRDKDQMIASNGKIRKPIEIFEYKAGRNISISEDHVISATGGGGGGTTYTAGDNIQISPQNVISATDTKYTAGANVQISQQNVISATDTKYTAGQNISIDANNVISATGGGTYTAGAGISIDENNVITNTGIGSMSQEVVPWTTEALDLPYNPLAHEQTYTANQIWQGTVPAGNSRDSNIVKKIAVQLTMGYVYNANIAGLAGITTEYQCPYPEASTGYAPLVANQLMTGHRVPFKLKFNWVLFSTGEPYPEQTSVPDIEGYIYFRPNGNDNLVASYSVTLVLYADANNPIKLNAIKARIFAYK